MRILVTGGAGFIGSHTVDALLQRGHDVRIIDSLDMRVHGRQRPAHLTSEAEFVEGNVADAEALGQALRGVDAVFHFAAYQDYLTDFSRFFTHNSAATALLYEIIVNQGLPVQKVIVASSQAVYGEGKYTCVAHGVQYPGQRSAEQLQRGQWDVICPVCRQTMQPQWTDEEVARPHNCYGLSKRDQEEIALQLGRRYGIPSVALRYSIVQGPRQSLRNVYSGALRSFTSSLLHGRQPVIYEDGKQLRDYVSIHDVVRANLLVFDEPRADYQVFNVGSGRRVTVNALARMVIRTAGAKVKASVPHLYRMGDTRHIFSDISRIRALGWRPRVSQQEIVREYLSWAAAQPDVNGSVARAHSAMRASGVLRARHAGGV